MPSFNPRIFTNPDRLKQISSERLKTFLSRWNNYFEGRGLDLDAAPVDELPLEDIAAILMNPDENVPDEMVDALFYVHETASHESMEELLEQAEAAGIAIDADHEPTAADVSVQIWLANPMLLQRQHAETVAFKRSNFMYFAGSRKKGAPKTRPDIPPDVQTAIQDRMDDWFEKKRRGRNSRIFVFPRDEKVWILVRHGSPMRREGKHEDKGEGSHAFYRP